MHPRLAAERQGMTYDPPLVQLLGAVRVVTGDGATISLPSASQRRLLALLALGSGTTLRSEHICELLDLSTGALRTTVSRLRRRIGDMAITTDAVGYCIGCPVDATRFADLVTAADDRSDRLVQLDAALSLWHGPVLDEFRHEAWAAADATRLEELRCLAIEERAAVLVRRGRSGEVVADLESYVTEHPLRDQAWGLLMEALTEQGRRSEALRRYQEYRRLLAEQTGLEPSEMLRSIERRIAAAAEHPRATADPPAVTESRSDGSTTEVLVPLPGIVTLGATLIGRRRELAELEHALDAARSGRLRSVVLSGEAGIGKTTLLAAFARTHHGSDGATVLYGRCEDGGVVPLQPLRDIAAALVEHVPSGLLHAHCERFGGELQRVAPSLRRRLWVPPPTTGDGAVERHLLFAAITDLVRRSAATGALALLLDDLHWAEPTALLLVRHLAQELADAPVLLVVSYRDVGVQLSAELRATLADLDCIDATRIHLEGLDDAALAALVASVAATDGAPNAAPTTEVVHRLRDQSAGNPLYTTHLVHHLVEVGALVVDGGGLRLADRLDDTGVPDSLVGVVLSRVQSLGPEAQSVLRAAAVLGVEFDDHHLRAICDVDEDDVAVALDAAVSAGLLVEGDHGGLPMRFTHALVARALVADIGGSARRRLEQRVAKALRAGDDEPSRPTRSEGRPTQT